MEKSGKSETTRDTNRPLEPREKKNSCVEKTKDENDMESRYCNRSGYSITITMMVINFVGSIAIIMCNKSLYSAGNVPPIFLACFQFFVTFCGLLLLKLCNVYQVKRVSMWKILPLCVAFCSFIIFTNFSLKYNTVGMYQLIKCLSDPLTFFLQVKFYGRILSRRECITLTIIVVGIFLNYFSDVEINVLGGLFGLIGVVASSLYYTWVGSKHSELKLSSMQLLFYQSSVSSGLLAFAVCSFELRPVLELPSQINSTHMFLIMLSGFLAFCVNTSVFFIIQRTSVITYAVFCKLKICLIILGGYVFFAELMTPMQGVGTAITLMGTFYYSYLKVEYNKKTPADTNDNKDLNVSLLEKVDAV